MEESKKKWSKPKLIVLVRGDMQERVLMSCKGVRIGASAHSVDNNCLDEPDCGPCSAQSPS